MPQSSVRTVVCLLISLVFTALLVHYSARHWRLLLPPTHDDVTYLSDGLTRLEVLYGGGLSALAAEHLRHPPHSPFSTYLALLGFGLFGPADWAPYVLNVFLVFVLLLFVDHLTARTDAVFRAAILLFVLSIPVASVAVTEFRPDIACALLTAMGVVLLRGSGGDLPTRGQRILAGICFGLALLFKPTIFPLTLSLLAVAVAADALRELRRGPASRRNLAAHAVQVLGPAALLGLPEFALTGSYYVGYLRAALFAPAKPIPSLSGTLAHQLGYYLVGEGGQWMLDWHVYLLPLVIATSMTSLALRTEGRAALRSLALGLLPLAVAYVVPTLNPVKQPFFALAFVFLLLFLAVEAMASVARLVAPRRARAAAVVASGLAVAGLLYARPRPSMGKAGDIAVRARRDVVERVWRGVERAPRRPGAHILVTAYGTVTGELLQYMALQRGAPGLTGDNLPLSFDDAALSYYLDKADLVLASETANGELLDLPGRPAQDALLATLRADGRFGEIATFPSSNGGSYVLFARR